VSAVRQQHPRTVVEEVLVTIEQETLPCTAVAELLSDIIVGKTFEKHLNNLAKVSEHLESAGMKLQPHKCHFLQSEAHFLGHVVSSQGVYNASISKWLWPLCITLPQSILHNELIMLLSQLSTHSY